MWISRQVYDRYNYYGETYKTYHSTIGPFFSLSLNYFMFSFVSLEAGVYYQFNQDVEMKPYSWDIEGETVNLSGYQFDFTNHGWWLHLNFHL
ncbi:hypothetical protein JXI42_01930 [bacterium]|nr:hypothetical protein [bacterium]